MILFDHLAEELRAIVAVTLAIEIEKSLARNVPIAKVRGRTSQPMNESLVAIGEVAVSNTIKLPLRYAPRLSAASMQLISRFTTRAITFNRSRSFGLIVRLSSFVSGCIVIAQVILSFNQILLDHKMFKT